MVLMSGECGRIQCKGWETLAIAFLSERREAGMDVGADPAGRGLNNGRTECLDPSSHEDFSPGWYFNDDHLTLFFIFKNLLHISFL